MRQIISFSIRCESVHITATKRASLQIKWQMSVSDSTLTFSLIRFIVYMLHHQPQQKIQADNVIHFPRM